MYKILPIEISSTSEVYSRKMAAVLQDLEDTLNLMNDICVYGWSMDEHNKRLHKVLQRLVKAGVTLNYENVYLE